MVFLIRCMVVFVLTILANPRIKLFDNCHASPTGITLELVHRDHVASPHLSRAERLSQMVRRDMQRWNNIINGIRRRRTLEEEDSAATTTIQSGSDYGIGQYLVKVHVGTPPQTVYMVPDTGSVLNMFKCLHKGKNNMSTGPFFDADKSSSFTVIPCNTDKSSFCGNNLTYMVTGDHRKKPTCVEQTCAYSYGYVDGSSTSGIFANESFTFPQPNNIVVKNMVIGCSTLGENLNSINGTHGILGFGNFPLSFPAQASPIFGREVFAMCLVDHLSNLSVAGTFVFGSMPEEQLVLPPTMNYTKLDTTSFQGQRLYGLDVTGVYIDGTRMDNITSDVWNNLNESGGTIVDTGTSLTFLNPLAYQNIMDALNRAISRSMDSVVDDKGTFQYCYDTKIKYNQSSVPILEIEFDGGVRLQPDRESYLIEVSESMRCLGFMLASAGYSTIGNILLQQHFLVFDVQNNKFGFGKSPCTSTT